MPRTPRALIDGGIYHVYSRGNNRRDLFIDQEDFSVFLEELLRIKAIYNLEVFHYCLMTNHFHMLVKVQKGEDLPNFMHRLKLAYARYHKKKYGFLGHLFQGRFRSPRIPEESYYLQCGRYIERNPVHAKMVLKAEDYLYSSASYYVKGTEDKLITPNLYYEAMGNDPQERRETYQKFLLIEDPYRSMVDEVLNKV